jgi:hypothetical protein
MITADELSAEAHRLRVERARMEAGPAVAFEQLPEADQQAWEDIAEAVRRLEGSARAPSIPAKVQDERAMQLIRLARECIELALGIAPNWTDSKLTVEDVQELEQTRRRLLALEIDAL